MRNLSELAAIAVTREGGRLGRTESPGDLGFTKDKFGHAQFGASETTVQQALVNYLNKERLPARGSARGWLRAGAR